MAHRGYVSSRLVDGQLVPQRVQNLVIRDYCRQSKLDYLLSLTEYVIEDSFVMLATLLEELPSLEGVVFYSLFQLPIQKGELWKIFNKISNHQRDEVTEAWNINIMHTDYPIVIELFGRKDIVAYVKIEHRDPFTAPEAPPKMREFSQPIDATDIISKLIEITRDFD